MNWKSVFAGCIVGLWAGTASALDHVSFRRQDMAIQVSGKVLVEAEDGGILIQDRAGVLWAVTPDEKTAFTQDDTPYEPLERDELGKHLLSELPAGFRIHSTAHYLIAYNTSLAYAQWCGALYERLFKAFTNYWEKRGLKITEPTSPLVALVFDSKQSFAQYGRKELGDATSSIIGYFSLTTNRVTMYDLTGTDAIRTGGRNSSTEHINRLLSRPEAERTVATIVHEATHQIAYNCGLHVRYADIPLWLAEGVAIYFETPDLRSSKGWAGIDGVNQVRLADFRRYFRSRPADSLRTLLASDERFRNSSTAADAYAEAWALTYFLIRKYPDRYKAYMKLLSEKKPLLYDSPDERLTQFREIFGKELAELDAEFVRYIAAMR